MREVRARRESGLANGRARGDTHTLLTLEEEFDVVGIVVGRSRQQLIPRNVENLRDLPVVNPGNRGFIPLPSADASGGVQAEFSGEVDLAHVGAVSIVHDQGAELLSGR